MTLKQFSEKYGVSYRNVFEASYGLGYITNRDNEKHYDEQDLKQNVVSFLNGKFQRATAQAEKFSRMIRAVSG